VFDLSKLSEKVFIWIVLTAGLLASVLFGISYLNNEPFSVYGKAFGFGSDVLQKRTAELEKCQIELPKMLDAVQGQLADAKIENQQLRAANAALLAQQQNRASQDAALWFPIDDVQFLQGGEFLTSKGKRGRGKWSDQDSELTLQLVVIDEGEFSLETNLPPPANKIRIRAGGGVLVHMSKWDYQLSAREIGSEKVEVRVERRSRSQV